MNIQYTTVDAVLAKLHRDITSEDIVETDVIEWTGEALEHLELYQIKEQAITFRKVDRYETDLPKHFSAILRISRDNNWTDVDLCEVETEIIKEAPEDSKNCGCGDIFNEIIPISMNWEFSTWKISEIHSKRFTPIRLADNAYFNSVVCPEKDMSLYNDCRDEYTIVGTQNRKLRFSFPKGFVAIAYLKNPIDDATGYPLIPDDTRYINAIVYYIKWKLAQRFIWSGRLGYVELARDSERLWLKYSLRAKSHVKMLKTEDEYANFIENFRNKDFKWLDNFRRSR